jgi:hypothetical protein
VKFSPSCGPLDMIISTPIRIRKMTNWSPGIRKNRFSGGKEYGDSPMFEV